VHHYNSTQYCSTETVLFIFAFLQTNITPQMWPSDLTFKSRSSATAPTYLSRHIKARVIKRTLRSSTAPLLDKPFTRTDFANRAFRCSAPTVWNSLRETIIRCNSLSRFKSKLLKTYFSTRPLTNTHDWPAASASEATALQRYTNQIIIIIIIIIIRGKVYKNTFASTADQWLTPKEINTQYQVLTTTLFSRLILSISNLNVKTVDYVDTDKSHQFGWGLSMVDGAKWRAISVPAPSDTC